MQTIDLVAERRDREIRWIGLEIARLERLVRIHALDRADTDVRIVELQDRLAGLSAAKGDPNGE
jgi:hypothetical protein